MTTRVAVLTDPGRVPDDEQIREHLGASFAAWQNLEVTLRGPELGLTLLWHHFRDGGWLCKALRGKKNVAWLAVWEGFATVTCYFSARHRRDLAALPLPDTLRTPDRRGGDVRSDAAGRRRGPLPGRRRGRRGDPSLQAPSTVAAYLSDGGDDGASGHSVRTPHSPTRPAATSA